MKKLRIKIDGKGGVADFSDFAEVARAVSEALTATHQRLHPSRQSRPRYNIVGLNVGSAEALIAPDSPAAGTMIAFIGSLTDIRAGQLPRGRVSSDDLRKYKKIGKALDSRTESILVGDVQIDARFRKNCDELIENAPTGLGEVVGTLQGVNTHKSTTFWIYLPESNVGAKCFVRDPQLYERMMKMFDHRVRLTGKIRRNPDGAGVDRIDVDDAEKLPEKSEVPTLASLAGIWRNDAPFPLKEIRSGWND